MDTDSTNKYVSLGVSPEDAQNLTPQERDWLDKKLDAPEGQRMREIADRIDAHLANRGDLTGG